MSELRRFQNARCNDKTTPIVAMAQLILMNIQLNRSEVFIVGEGLHIVVFGMRVVLCFTETFVLETK